MIIRLLPAVASSLLIASCATADRNNIPSIGGPQTESVAVPSNGNSMLTGNAELVSAGSQVASGEPQKNNQKPSRIYSFFDVVESALASDTDYAIARENLQTAILDLTLTKREYFPDVKAQYEIDETRYSNVDAIDTRQREASITIAQPLFDPTSISNRRIAKLELDQAEAEFVAERDLLLTKVIVAYVSSLRTDASVAFRRQDLTAIQEQKRESRTLQQLGVLTTIDVSEIDAQLNLAVATLLEAEDRAFKDKSELFDLTGLDPNLPIATLIDNLEVGALLPTTAEDWVSIGLKNNTQIIASDLNVSVLDAKTRAPYAKHIPSLLLEGSFVKPFESLDEDTETNTSVKFSVTMSLFDRGRTNAAVAKERTAKRIAQYQAQFTRRKLTKEIRNNYHLAQSSVARIKANIRAVDAFTDAEKSIESGFELGVRTALDLLTARRSKLQSENLRVNAQLDYFQSALLLRLDANMLSIDELREYDRFFNHSN